VHRESIVLVTLWLALTADAEGPPQANREPPAAEETPERYPAELLTPDTAVEHEALGLTGTPIETTPVPGTDPPPPPPERIVWQRAPIPIALPVGREKMVHFPAEIKAGFDSPSPPEGLRTQSVADTVYWQASQPFSPRRAYVQERASGRLYLIDLEASEQASAAPVQIVLPPPPGAEKETDETHPAASAPRYTFVQLTRFAAQQLYAPRRLLRTLPGISRMPVPPAPVPLVRGGKVAAEPLIGWRGGDYYLTAVRLRNVTPQPVELDPRELRGHWYTATFQHARLFPAGDEADSTCVYLISARPFHETLQGID
jgi:integrating conjugative element protein (TIGR03749 family)